MKWTNLKQNRCPQCNKDFMKGLKTKSIVNDVPIVSLLLSGIEPIQEIKLLMHPCGFTISEAKYNKIVADMVEQQMDQDLDDELEEFLRANE